MTDIGQIERRTQNRVVALISSLPSFRYLGNLTEQFNENIRKDDLLSWLASRGVEETLATQAVEQLWRTSNDVTKSLYQRNRDVYEILCYGIQVRPSPNEHAVKVWLVDWKDPLANDFAVAEEVTVPVEGNTQKTKRPDVVIYVNGIALSVLELKRSTVAVSEGIRQNLENQRSEFIESFFSTAQWLCAGNDTQGLHYGTIGTQERYYLKWKEDGPETNLLDRSLRQIYSPERFLELIHDFVVFDAGTKKLCRPNQYFGVRAAEAFALRKEGGVIWHTQGSGKSLTMVWLAKWIREHVEDARVLVVTDRDELDKQIEQVFLGVDEQIYRAKGGKDLLDRLGSSKKWLLCSLIHKFGSRAEGEGSKSIERYIDDLRQSLPDNFSAKGQIYVFVDECHRTQAGLLHAAMREILPSATLIGFTGTPLLRSDKVRTIERFGPYIHTYKFDEAVRDGVIVDLRYEARDVDQRVINQEKVDQLFAAKTMGLTPYAKAELKKRWGTMQQVLSSRDRLSQIVGDIALDMETRPRLMDGHGNAILVASSIYEACVYYELFNKTPALAGKVGIVTSYKPTLRDLVGEESGEGATVPVAQFNVYKQMLADWFHDEPDDSLSRASEYEDQVKERFVKEPARMKLLVVVDKLLTGFDAPSATYLYIDKQMRDHGLFQAICRVNRIDRDDKEYGYVIDYKDLFKSLETAVRDYTSNALDGYSKDDTEGLLKDRLASAKQELEDALEVVRALVEPVEKPKDSAAYLRYFCAADSGDAAQLTNSEPRRVALYESVGKLLRAFTAVANDAPAAGFTSSEFASITREVRTYSDVRDEVRLASGDYIDLKMYEPSMRHLIDTYIKSDGSKKISTFDDVSFVQLIVERGQGALANLPATLSKPTVAAEVIDNNVRRVIIEERPINPKYFDTMSALLDALIIDRRQGRIDYETYLKRIQEIARQVVDPSTSSHYPSTINSPGRRALFDQLNADEVLATKVDRAVVEVAPDGWRTNTFKERRVRQAVEQVLEGTSTDVEAIFELIKNHREY